MARDDVLLGSSGRPILHTRNDRDPMPTGGQLQHLYQQLHRTLDEEGATTMIELLGPYARHEPATKADVDALRLEMRAEMAGLEQRLSPSP